LHNPSKILKDYGLAAATFQAEIAVLVGALAGSA
jgi:hypothetical protein